MLPAGRAYAAAAISAHHVFIAGGFRWDAGKGSVIYYDDVLVAPIQTDGTLGQWSPVAAFPTGRSGIGMTVLEDCVFTTGGTWSAADKAIFSSDVHSGRVSPSGTLQNFRKSAHGLNVARSNHTVVAYDGGSGRYLYTIAGVTQLGNDTVHLDTVEYAPINDTCDVGPWSIAHFDVKGGRSSPQAVLVKDHIYVVGGWGDIDLVDIYNDVQYTRIREDGSLAPWRTSAHRLPSGLYGHATSVIPLTPRDGALLLVLGGQPSTGVYSGAITFMYIVPNQLPAYSGGPWTFFPRGLGRVRAGHAAVYTRGRLYVIGGVQPGGVYLDEVIVTEVAPGVPE